MSNKIKGGTNKKPNTKRPSSPRGRHNVVVKNAHLSKDCEGCMAAKRALEGYKDVVALAQKKIRSQCKEIKELKKRIELSNISSTTNCPMCSQSVTVEGDVTMYYVPTERIQTINELLELPLEDVIFMNNEYSKTNYKKALPMAKNIAKAMRDYIKEHFNV